MLFRIDPATQEQYDSRLEEWPILATQNENLKTYGLERRSWFVLAMLLMQEIEI